MRPLPRRTAGPAPSRRAMAVRDGQGRARPALEEAEGDLAHDQDERHQDRRQVAVVDARTAGAAGGRRRGRACVVTPAPSARGRGSPAGAASSSVLPEGQRTTAFSTTAPGPEPEVQPALVLGAEARAARDLLDLLPAVPVAPSPGRRWRCGCCTASAGASPPASAFEVEGDPVPARAPRRCGRGAAARAGWPPPRRARRGCRGRPGPPSGRRGGRRRPPSGATSRKRPAPSFIQTFFCW